MYDRDIFLYATGIASRFYGAVCDCLACSSGFLALPLHSLKWRL